MKRTNEKSCIISHVCSYAGNEKLCNNRCGSYIALHGLSGTGGRVSQTSIPSDYQFLTANNVPVRSSQPRVYKALDAYLTSFSRQFTSSQAPSERIKSVYLYSDSPGTGKTTTAAMLAHEWVIRHYIGSVQRGLQPEQRSAYFLDFNEFHTLYNSFNRPNIPKETADKYASEYYRKLDISKKVPFLVIDDIGVREDLSKPFVADAHDLINARVTNKLVTVYTSNVALKDLALMFDKHGRLYDRIRHNTIALPFEGESKRGLQKKEGN